jgi:hypothetical protein
MAVNPIDLQAIFSQMNQVGKQESAVKDSEIIRQDQANLIVNKESIKDSEYIPDAKDISEGAGKIKDNEKKNNQKKRKKTDKNKEKNSNQNDKNESDLKDPELGQKIDIIG